MTIVSLQSSSGLELVIDVSLHARGPTVLFLHGGGETRGVWKRIVPSVEALGWRCVAMDLRGHGDSGRALEYKINDFITDVIEVIAQCCDQPAAMIDAQAKRHLRHARSS